MKVGEICKREVATIRKEDSLLEAGKRMRSHHVGSLVVVEETDSQRFPIGILTDRDILIEVLAEGISLEKISVGDIMATDLVTAKEDEDVFETIQKMRKKAIRRIPVVDPGKNLIGIITMDDVIEIITEEIRDLSGIFSREKEREARTRP